MRGGAEEALRGLAQGLVAGGMGMGAERQVLGPDYNLYMDLQQAINLAIHDRFETERIDFAYPTREIILRRPEAARANAT